MIQTYKILSLLLDYPTETLHAALPSIGRQLRQEHYLDEDAIVAIEHLVSYASALRPIEWQEQYVALFDQGTGCNLYLFDHVYGSSRDRGQAMVDLKEMYFKGGFTPCADELPDFLPLFLEFLAMQSGTDKAELLLSEATKVLEGMVKLLERQQTPYTEVLKVVYNLSCRKGGAQ